MTLKSVISHDHEHWSILKYFHRTGHLSQRLGNHSGEFKNDLLFPYCDPFFILVIHKYLKVLDYRNSTKNFWDLLLSNTGLFLRVSKSSIKGR